MKIAHSIFLSFFFILLLFAITTLINFRLYQNVVENNQFSSRSTQIIRISGRFQRNILTVVSSLRGYLITGENSFIESYQAATAENEAILQDLNSLVVDSAQVKLLVEIRKLNEQWTDNYTEPLRQAKSLSRVSDSNLLYFNKIYKEKFATGEEKEIQNRLQQRFKLFANSEYAIRDLKKERLAESIRKTRRMSLILTMTSIISALVVITFLVRKISGRIRQMTNMANTISAGNYDVNIADTGNDELSSLGNSLNHMAHELSKNISLLTQSNAELDQFAHVVSHDLKGPLRGISNVVSWIDEDHSHELTPKMSEYLNLIKGRITRAEHLIAGLLDYARVDKDTLQKEEVDVKELITEVLDNLPDTRSISVTIGPMPTLHTERLLLFQVFSNLISNAYKHNHNENGRVNISYRRNPATCTFFIEDNGSGIDRKHQQRIFQIFQTLHDGDPLQNAGVGLAIVKKILDRKKQSITVSSKIGEGAVFSFTWPSE